MLNFSAYTFVDVTSPDQPVPISSHALSYVYNPLWGRVVVAGSGRFYEVESRTFGDVSRQSRLKVFLPHCQPTSVGGFGVRAQARTARAEAPAVPAWTVRPNPAGETVRINFDTRQIPEPTIQVFDIGGRRVATLRGPAVGRGTAVWDRRDERGRRVAAGVYFVGLTSGSGTWRQKVVLR